MSSESDSSREELVKKPGIHDTTSTSTSTLADSSDEELVQKPGIHDVLCGRGGGCNNHGGNIKFREIVQKHKLRYMVATKVEKPKVAREVVQLWRALDPPGRFLARKDDSRKGPGSVKAEGTIWYDVGDKKAREKASQCLREQAKEKDVQCLRELATDVIPFVTFVSEMQRQQEFLTTHDLACRTTNEETRESGQKRKCSNLETLYPRIHLACRPINEETGDSGQKRTFSNLETLYPSFDLAFRTTNEGTRDSGQQRMLSNLETLYPNFGDATGNRPFPVHYYRVYR